MSVAHTFIPNQKIPVILRATPDLHEEPAAITDPHRHVAITLEAARKLAGTDIPAALALSEKIIAFAGQRDSDGQLLQDQLAECFHLQGTLFLNKADYSAALTSFYKAKKINEALDNTAVAAVELCFIGVSQAYAGLYADALQNLRAALAIFEANDDRRMMANSLNSIGHTYGQLNEHAKGLPYLLKSVQIARDTDDKKALSTSLDSLCQAYLGIGDLDNALTCGLESVLACREIGALAREAEHLLSVGSVHLARSDSARAASCFQESLALARRYGYRFAEAGALRWLGTACRRQNQTAEALSFLRAALAIVQEIGAIRKTYQCLEDLAAVCKQAGDFETALNYYEQFQLAKEAIFNEQADVRLKSLEIAYEVEQTNKEKEIYYLRNVALQREIEERIKAQTAAEQLATTDQLTGLFNRRHLLYLADREIAQAVRYKQPLSLAIFDIDYFKRVNDNFGHAAGDKVLAIVSGYVRSSLRAGDIVGRYGGEEFVILLPQTSTKAALGKVEQIRTAIASLVVQAGNAQVSVTISSGIAGLLEPAENDRLDQLLERADRALYLAKEAGRNRSIIYQEPDLL